MQKCKYKFNIKHFIWTEKTIFKNFLYKKSNHKKVQWKWQGGDSKQELWKNQLQKVHKKSTFFRKYKVHDGYFFYFAFL